MNHLKKLAIAVVAAMALAAFAAAGSALATTMETEGTARNQTLGFTATLKSESTTSFVKTDGVEINTCTESEFNGDTVKDGDGDYTGPVVGATLVEFSFGGCREAVTVDKAGKLTFQWTKNTEATVSSFEAEITVKWGVTTVNCKTGAGNDIGTFTGVKAGNATLHVNTVLGCGFLAPSLKWTGTYEFTSPNGLGVVP